MHAPVIERAARTTALIALAALLAAAAPDVTVTGPQPPIPGQIVATGTYTYAADIADQHCTLQYWPAEANALLRTTARPAAMDQFAACLGPLLDAVLRDHPATAQLAVTLGDLTAITSRINAALDVSPKWDPATGSPRRGTLSGVICGVINDQHLARELAEAFQQRGYDLQATSARMITTGPAPGPGRHRLLTGIALLEFTAHRAIGGT